MANNIDDRMRSFTTNTNALATDLIALLDKFIFLEGYTLRTHPVRPETTLPSLPTDDTPIAVQMYATSSLTDHLNAHDQEIQTHNLLTSRIATLTAHSSVLQTANKIVDKGLAALSNSNPQTLQKPQTAKPTSLPSKLATLRHLQQLQLSATHPPEFKTHIATATTTTSSASPFTTLYLPLTTSWLDYADILMEYTQHPETSAEGFPEVYTLKGGKWYYQKIVNGRREEGFSELGCEGEYKEMRKVVGKGKGVLVWHEQILAASRAAKEGSGRVAGEEEAEVEVDFDFEGVDFEGSGVEFRGLFAE